MAAGTVALVALAAGIVVYRSMSGAEWAPPRAMETSRPHPVPPAWEMDPAALPALARAEDRASYEKGRRLLAAGDATAALGPLTEAARRFPGDSTVIHDYGLALVRAGQEDRGLFHLEHASRLAPGIGAYRLDLIRALLVAGRRGPAAKELDELVARDPGNLAAAELRKGLAEGIVSADDGAAPATASGGVDVGEAAGGRSPLPGVVPAFTNADLERRRAAPPAPVTLPPAVVAPSASSPALPASPTPPA